MLLEKTKFARKVDAMGRITIPIRLREATGIEIGEIYEYSILVDENGKKYLCIECPGEKKEKF